MRITGGQWCGRTLKVPSGDKVRPTQDRVRTALFSMLATHFPGVAVLDLFAGAGTFGLDALSRGATRVTWIESDRQVAATLKVNLAACTQGSDCPQAEICCSDALKWIQTVGIGRNYGIVFCDPPYRTITPELFSGIAADLSRNRVIAPDGIFIGESASRTRPEPPEDWEAIRDREYGHTRVVLWRPSPHTQAKELADV